MPQYVRRLDPTSSRNCMYYVEVFHLDGLGTKDEVR